MDRKTNPIGISVLPVLSLGATEADERRVLTALINRALSAEQARMGWLERQRALSRLRFGVRNPKTFPWRNASNLSIPFIDHAIRKYKPILMRLIVEPDPIVEFVGTDQGAIEVERIAEIVFNWLFKTEMEAIEPMAYLIDSLCHRGFSFLQIGWDYQTEYECRSLYVRDFFPDQLPDDDVIAQKLIDEYELNITDRRVINALNQAVQKIRSGEEFVRLAFRKTIVDRPAVWERDAVQMIAPPRCVDIGNAEWLVVQHVLSLREIKQKEADGYFVRGSVQKIINDMGRSQKIKEGKATQADFAFSPSLTNWRELENEREKIWGMENEDNILLWEIYHWFDYNNDGLVDRVRTFVHPRSVTSLGTIPYPYSFHCWPFLKYDFEKVNRRWHSPRGITQMLMDIQLEINAQHNARIDSMTLRNAPTYQQPLAGKFQVRNFRATPGTILHTQGGAEIKPLVQDRGAFPEQMTEENHLRAIGEHYIGIFDAAITSPTSTTKPRTAAEIHAIVQFTAATSTFDAILFQLTNRKMFSLIWELFMDLGPNEIKLKVAGSDPRNQSTNLAPFGFNPKVLEEQLISIKKADINKRFKLVPTGTIANTNRALELSNSREAISMFINDQSGYINPRELRNWYLSLLAQPRWSRRILNTPDQAQEQQILQRAAAALMQDPDLQTALKLGGEFPGIPELPRQEIAQSGQSGIEAQQP